MDNATTIRLDDLTDEVYMKLYASGTPVIFRGPPGCSKTSGAGDFCERNDLGFVLEFAPRWEPYNVGGVMMPQRDGDGSLLSVSAKPEWLVRIERSGKSRGVLMIDEVLAAGHPVQKACAPLFCERRIGEHLVPDGWSVWGTGNRTSDKAGADRMLGHVINKVMVLDVEPSMPSWLKWAERKGVSAAYRAFAERWAGDVISMEVPKDVNIPYPTLRSFTYAAHIHSLGLDTSDLRLPTDHVTQAMVAAHIGSALTTKLFAFIKTASEIPTVAEIEADPEGCHCPAPERMDAQYAAVQMIVSATTPDNADQMFRYLMRIEKELQTRAAVQIVAKHKGVMMNSPVVNKWMVDNPSLITAAYGD